jgi:hypothetical protein
MYVDVESITPTALAISLYSAIVGYCVFGAKRGKRVGEASPFPPFLSLIHILPICLDSAQLLHIYHSQMCHVLPLYVLFITDQYQNKYWTGYIGR